MERTRSNLETQASLALGQTKQLVDDAILIVEAVSSDINFYSLFTESFDETTVLNSLFLLLTNWKYKPEFILFDPMENRLSAQRYSPRIYKYKLFNVGSMASSQRTSQ